MSKSFLIDLDPNVEPKKYELILCKLNGEQLQELHNIDGLEFKFYFVDIDEIRFEVPLYRMESDGTKVKNELFDLVDGGMLVLVDNSKYFILTKPEIKANNETGETFKSILGFSREYEFVNRRLSGYHGVSRLLYDHTNAKDENGLEIGFLNYIEKTTSWKVGYINPDLLLKYRELNFASATYLQAFQEVQKTFGCLFKYDTINKTIDVYKNDQIGTNQGLLISDYNFINNLNQAINYDDIKTRLILKGRDDISIQSINITGLPYIDNFSFFKNTKYMSQSLIDALDDYEDYLETKEGIFSGYLSQLNTLNDTLATKRIELADLITELKLIESDLDVAIASRQSTTALKQQQTAKITQINNKQLEIDSIMTQIDGVHTNINDLGADVSLNNHLSEEQAIELDPFIREEEYRDNNYTEDNLEEFLEEGTKILKRISYPNLQFTIDVDDFLTLTKGQHLRSKFVLGDLATLEYEELAFDYEVRFVGYTHNPENKKLNLIFSNRNSVDDANIYISDLLESITTTASTVDFNRYKWDKGEEAEFIINEYVNNALNLAKQQLIKADGQKPMADERGIWLIKENPDGTVDKGQLRLIHNCIALTNDNWNSLEIAISAEMGINANLIRGKIGEFAQLNANQIVVGDEEQELLDYIDQQKSDLDDAINNLDDVITDAFSDDYITNIEANSIKLARDNLATEADKLINIATLFDLDVSAVESQLNVLDSFITLYIESDSYPKRIFQSNKDKVIGGFKYLKIAIVDLYNAVENKKIDDLDYDLTDYIIGVTETLTGLIDGKIDTWFYEGVPTLINNPAVNWDTNKLKDKHLNDLYYDTLTGYTYRFVKEDVYKWIKITDEDIVNAMSAASNAQDTADNKRRIFVVQPSTPYDKGDLWHVTNVDGVDFKICTKTRSKNESYSASDWENVEKSKDYIDSQISDLDDALDDLQDNINAFGKDLILTATEASMITIDLEKATSDSENLVIMAASLGITTERIDYDNAAQEIYSYLYTNWLEKEYPLEITEIQVSAVTDCFNDIEKKKTILINKISEVRNDNLKNYVDNNAVMQDFDYNKTKITQQEGIEVYDNLNNKVLQIGGIDTTGDGIKDNFGFIAYHEDGSATIVDNDAFKRLINESGNIYTYVSLSHADTLETTGTYSQSGSESSPITPKTAAELDDMEVGVDWITIPNVDFKGRNFIVIPSLLSIGSILTGESGGSYSTVWSHFLETDLEILDYDYVNAKFLIRARKREFAMYRGSYMNENWKPVVASYYAYAVS